KADNAFGAKDYISAKSSYTEANGLKPSEAYPKQKLSEIDKLLADASKQKDVDDKYKAAITKGDNSFKAKNYASAKSSFTEASGLKPSEQYPKTQLAEIEKLLNAAASQKELDEKYKSAILKGDNSFKSKDYASAKSSFTEASGLKPSEQYPKTKLDEIEKLLNAAASQKELDEKYKSAISKGDNSFKSKDYASAKSSFTEASGLKPSEQYPKSKLEEIEKLLNATASQKELEEKYKSAISKGDNSFKSKDYSSAKSSYTEASGIKPNEIYPKNKLEEIDRILKEASDKVTAEKALNENYNAAIGRGDIAFKEKAYANAKVAFNEALTYKPNEQYPKDKLAEIQKLEMAKMAAQEQHEKDVKYNQAIGKADQFFKIKNYVPAKSNYEEALTYKPDEKYPKERIKMIEDILKSAQKNPQIAKNETKQTQTVAVSEEDKQKQYQSELRSKYPNGVTEEEFTDNGKTILRRVVIRDDYAGVYTKVTHNWGGVYCFKDNIPISEVAWENETK
ncbi:MAG TPA: hypothetical protein VII99_10350, partial [Bacteroidia bacterium]